MHILTRFPQRLTFKRHTIGAAAFFVLALLFSAPHVHAVGSFHVAPVQVFLSAKTTSALLTLRNEGDEDVRLQLNVFEWSQGIGGEIIAHPTDDILVFPLLLTLGPHQERKVRIGIPKPMLLAKERTYRLFIEELPSKRESNPNEVRVLMKLGIPIFLHPATGTQAHGAIKQLAVRKGQVTFEVVNDGNVHFVMKRVQVKGQGSKTVEAELPGGYLLEGSSRAYTIALTHKDCEQLSSVSVEVSTAEGQFREEIPVAPEHCEP